MNEKEFHKRVKEILSPHKQDPRNSPGQAFHEALANNVKGRSGKEWDDEMAVQVIRELEWATDTQPKRDDIKEDKIKNILDTFLSKRGYTLSTIQEGSEKTPDCYIEKGEHRYVCEIKSPVLMFDNKTQTYKFKTSHTKLLNFIHTAVKQFKEQDPNHKLPWILVFTSSHPQLNWKTFTDTIQGGVIHQNGNRLPDFSKTPVYTSTQPLIYEIDAYIWFQVNVKDEKFYQASYFLSDGSIHKDESTQLLNDLAEKSLSNMDNVIVIETSSRTAPPTPTPHPANK